MLSSGKYLTMGFHIKTVFNPIVFLPKLAQVFLTRDNY
jgi:hypothetical protein